MTLKGHFSTEKAAQSNLEKCCMYRPSKHLLWPEGFFIIAFHGKYCSRLL